MRGLELQTLEDENKGKEEDQENGKLKEHVDRVENLKYEFKRQKRYANAIFFKKRPKIRLTCQKIEKLSQVPQKLRSNALNIHHSRWQEK